MNSIVQTTLIVSIFFSVWSAEIRAETYIPFSHHTRPNCRVLFDTESVQTFDLRLDYAFIDRSEFVSMYRGLRAKARALFSGASYDGALRFGLPFVETIRDILTDELQKGALREPMPAMPWLRRTHGLRDSYLKIFRQYIEVQAAMIQMQRAHTQALNVDDPNFDAQVGLHYHKQVDLIYETDQLIDEVNSSMKVFAPLYVALVENQPNLPLSLTAWQNRRLGRLVKHKLNEKLENIKESLFYVASSGNTNLLQEHMVSLSYLQPLQLKDPQDFDLSSYERNRPEIAKVFALFRTFEALLAENRN